MSRAEQFLREDPFDLVVCTIVFDESKMFDLLRLVKSRPELQQIPFVSVRAGAHIFRSPRRLDGIAFTCRELGADFFDIADYQVEPERELRESIEALLRTRHVTFEIPGRNLRGNSGSF